MPDWLKFTNRGQSTLDGGIDDDDITLAVADPSKFPITFPFRLTIDNEIVEVTDGGGTAIDPYDITRGEEGTTPAAHSNGAIVRLNITAGIVEQVQDELDTHGTATTGVHGVGVGTVAKTADITATKLDDFAAPDDNTDLDASTSKHGLVVKATAPAAGLYNYVGITNGETAYTNKALFDATSPSTQAFGDSAAAGSAAVSARRDHKHAMMADPVPTHSALTTGVHGLDGRRNAIINGCAIVDQRATNYTLVKDTYGIRADRFYGMATGTAVSAGTFTKVTSANCGKTGHAFKFSGVTLTGTGIIYLRYRMEAKDAIQFINQVASFACKVYHDVGSSINYTVFIRKANAADNFSAVTAISNSGAISISSATATTLKYENISMGDCSNGIEIEIKVECGAITTKNFEFTECQFELGSVATTFEFRPYQQEVALCQRYACVNDSTFAYAYGATSVAIPYTKFVKMRLSILSASITLLNGTNAYADIGVTLRNITGSISADGTASYWTVDSTTNPKSGIVAEGTLLFEAEL